MEGQMEKGHPSFWNVAAPLHCKTGVLWQEVVSSRRWELSQGVRSAIPKLAPHLRLVWIDHLAEWMLNPVVQSTVLGLYLYNSASHNQFTVHSSLPVAAAPASRSWGSKGGSGYHGEQESKQYWTNTVVEVDTVDKFKLRLDKFWMHQDIKYDFTAELAGTGDRSECDSGNYY